ncbi:uncharacterized protein LOC129603668 [Betta splendens]|uniref:Uncharacterized protein LOC129603668 n=1 Tax=Betta splendens TaxID=158456 RepID=A0A9W2XKF7_BETSP|nr:uncharacterized protein LOC129603668 [Betta splendens]
MTGEENMNNPQSTKRSRSSVWITLMDFLVWSSGKRVPSRVLQHKMLLKRRLLEKYGAPVLLDLSRGHIMILRQILWINRGFKQITTSLRRMNRSAEYRLETPKSKWETPPKVVENERAKILWDFQIQTDRMVMANQPDIVVVDKEQSKVVVVDVAIPSDGNIRKKEHEKLEKYQGLREELEKAWKVKATVVVIGALGVVTPNLEEWLRHPWKNIRHLSPEKCSPRNSKDTAQNPQAPWPLVEDPSLESG